jgi:hypothetical protein
MQTGFAPLLMGFLAGLWLANGAFADPLAGGPTSSYRTPGCLHTEQIVLTS